MNQPPLHQPSLQPAPKKGMSGGAKVAIGCGSGCLFLVVLTIVAGVLAVNWLKEAYTDAAPIEIVVEESYEVEVEAASAKLDTFRADLANGRDTAPLILTAKEVNTLLNHHPDFSDVAGKVKIEIIEDKIGGTVSIPLDKVHPLVDGRYLNARILVRAQLVDENLTVELDSVEINGDELPEAFLAGLGKELTVEKLGENPELEKLLDDLNKVIESFTVENGVLKIVPKKQAP